MKGIILIGLLIWIGGTAIADNEYWIHIKNATFSPVTLTAKDVDCLRFNSPSQITIAANAIGTFDVTGWWKRSGHCNYLFGNHPHIIITDTTTKRSGKNNIDFELTADGQAELLRYSSINGAFYLSIIPHISCSANKYPNDYGDYVGANICLIEKS